MNTGLKRLFAAGGALALALSGAWLARSIGRSSQATLSPPTSRTHASVTTLGSAPAAIAFDSTGVAALKGGPLAPTPAVSLSIDAGRASPDLERWARQRPAEALVWVRQTPNGPDRVIVAEILCLQLARLDPAAAVALVTELHADGYVLDNVVQQWAERDITAAEAYVSNLPPSPDRDRLAARVALVESKTRPADAASRVARQISPGQIQTDAAIAVLHQWLKQDRSAALAWMDIFPRGEVRDRALDEIDPVFTPSPP